jgi:predicted phage terminase large subunit-like protein
LWNGTTLNENKSALQMRDKAWQEILSQARRGNFIAFTKWTKKDYQFNWHHEVVAEKLQKFANKEIKNLMLFMPPRHGKSELASRRLPAFVLGLNPKAKIIATSYSADLASMMNRDVQRIIDSKEYQEIFPDTQLSGENVRTAAQGNWLRNNDVFEVVGHGGTYRSAGVGGGITGMGGDFIIIDDPIKNQAEADSETYRKKVWDWFTSTLFTRREGNCSMCVIMTRWHEDDLAGRLLDMDKDALKNGLPSLDWEIVSFPMILEKEPGPDDPRKIGEVLWPRKYSPEQVQVMKTVTSQNEGARVWNALFQQEPVVAGGTIIKRAWLSKFYRQAPPKFDEIIQSWDMTFKGGESSDYVVGGIVGRIGAEKYLLDMVRFKGDFIQTLTAVRSLSAKWPKAHLKLIEAKANGEAVIASLQKEITGIVPVHPDQSKQARLISVSPEFEAGNLLLPDPSIAPWVHDVINELVSFPGSKHDDIVDMLTQALQRFRDKRNSLDKILRM